MTAFRSLCYGLGIEADAPVPGLAAVAHLSTVDVRLHVGRMPDGLDRRRDGARRWRAGSSLDGARVPALVVSTLADGGDFLFQYVDGTEFLIAAGGDEIWSSWAPSSSVDDMATYLLGPVFGFVLRLHGTTCLHASVVVLPGGAVGFVGSVGAGKSTLAATFARLGRAVVTDDVAALVEDHGTFLVQPGYPRLRLRPGAVTALFGSADALPALTPNWDKRYLDLGREPAALAARPQPLAAMYLLGPRGPRDEAPAFSSVPPRDGLLALIANAYVTTLIDQQARAREFGVLGRMAETLPLRQVSLPDGPDTLDPVCLAIERDAAALAAARAAPSHQPPTR